MFFGILLIFCAVNTLYAQEGDSCTKDGVPGVCTALRQCPDALQDIKNRIKPQHCVLGTLVPIVCCVSPVTTTTTTTTQRPQNCMLPPYPEHGSYTTSILSGRPGEVHEAFVVNVTCNPGHIADGPNFVFCRDGWWTEKMPNCVSASCTKEGVTGVCTKLKQCPAAQQDIMARKQPQHCWFGTLDPIVCCVPSTVGTTAPEHTTKSTSVVSTTEHAASNHSDGANVLPGIECSVRDLIYYPVKPTGQKAWDKCMTYQETLVYPCSKSGRSYRRADRCHHPADEPVSGAVDVQPYELSHMAVLGYQEDMAEVLLGSCMGALISEFFVLTTAFCTHSIVGGPVTYVKLQLLRHSALAAGDRYSVERVVKHPRYEFYAPATYNDIALLQLERQVLLDEFTVPACIHTGTLLPDSRALIAGWSFFPNARSPDTIQKVVVKKVEIEVCEAEYGPYEGMKDHAVNRTTHLCYQDGACHVKGEAGTPLLVKNSETSCMYTIIGVLSFGKRCNQTAPYPPDVFTQVAPYLEWIENIVWPRNVDDPRRIWA